MSQYLNGILSAVESNGGILGSALTNPLAPVIIGCSLFFGYAVFKETGKKAQESKDMFEKMVKENREAENVEIYRRAQEQKEIARKRTARIKADGIREYKESLNSLSQNERDEVYKHDEEMRA